MQTATHRAGFAFITIFTVVAGCGRSPSTEAYDASSDSLRFEGETHLRNIRQLTFGGNNAEAYWSPDGTELTFQSTWDRLTSQGCDQIFVMNADGTPRPSGRLYDRVSTDSGRTTCSYFLPDGRILFASTHMAGPECPPETMFDDGRYVWPIYAEYDIYTARPNGGGDAQPLIVGPGYDAEATVSPDGRWVVFTSTRSGDLELWRYDLHSGEVLQLTHGLGYDGGAFFSHDSRKIVWRADRPEGEDADLYRSLLERNLVQPSHLNIWVANADGSDARQVTDLEGANWAPYFHPSDQKIVFTSNHHTMAQGGREFDLFMINLDGSDLVRITHSGTFDAFPMFSPDGSKLVFASNRNVSRTESRDTNIFVADWVD